MTKNPIPLLRIPADAHAIFKSRPNRYLAVVDIDEPQIMLNEKTHVHDPGRLTELLFPGNELLLQHKPGEHRKTQWDVTAAKFEGNWILIHSGFHRMIVEELFQNPAVCPFPNLKNIQAEVTYGHSRLDFQLTDKENKKIWVETKGCTLARDKIALFPDAPTKRGAKHIQSLIELTRNGDQTAIIILVFRKDAGHFAPNRETDPEFTDLFYQAIDEGVEVFPLLLEYENSFISYLGRIPIYST